MRRRLAVVLFNLGGPDRPQAVRPFLFNLFSDPAIIAMPGLVRIPLAALIARRRAPVARTIYSRLGGGSPILENTEAQAAALGESLEREHPEDESRVFVAMRYWHPTIETVARDVVAWGPDRLVLLPLYPQFSTTTTASAFSGWNAEAGRVGLAGLGKAVCCYPELPGFVGALAQSVRAALADWQGPAPRILFSAHGLPKKVIARGDPYQWQVERTAAAIAKELAVSDWVVCYQSRVGPLEWIGPSTESEIRRAGKDGAGIVVVPIAFVSEHAETLVELDIDYRRLAEEAGVKAWRRVATVSADAGFIGGLAKLVVAALASPGAVCSAAGTRICPRDFGRCPLPA